MALRGEKELDTEFRVVWPSGTIRHIAARAQVHRNAVGQPAELIGTNYDITERKQAEQALIQSRKAALNMMRDAVEARDRAEQLNKALRIKNLVFDASIAANSIADLNGNITEANEAFLRVWGYPGREEVVGKPLLHFINDPNEAVAIDTALNSTGQWEGDYTAKRKDGSTFIAHGLATTVKDEKGTVIGYQSAVNDVTGQRESENELQKHRDHLEQLVAERTVDLTRRSEELDAANKELDAFSHSVSHDLRAPLRGIDGWSLALLEDYGGQLDEQGRTFLNRVRAETQRMGGLVDDLLQLSRLSRAEMHRQPVDLSGIARKVVARLRETAPERSVEFIVQPDLVAQGDAPLLEVALTNLLGNAFKFTGKRTQARIEFGRADGAGGDAFFVRDNGAGFDMAYAKKLFGAFQRMHKTSDFPGTGIGLATVQRIVHRHGGRVWAEAAAGHGATFYFTLGGNA
jgi:PAS domain S-box-containing protein